MAKTEYDPFGDTIEKEEKPKLKKIEAKEEWIRKTFVIKDKYADLINRKAYWERIEKKEVLNEALEGYFKGKKIKEYPK
jgi:hypothetical protein